MYFDWSVRRFAVHNGWGERFGSTVYNISSGSGDTQAYGPVFTLP